MKASWKPAVIGLALFYATPVFSLEDPRIAIGRSLSSNCTQCHATNGQPRSGGNASLTCANTTTAYTGLKQRIIDLRNKDPYSDLQKQLMILHAKSYSDGTSYWGGKYSNNTTYLDGKPKTGAPVMVPYTLNEIDAIAWYLCQP